MLRGVTGLLDSDWQNLVRFLTLGGDFTLLGLSLPGLITFLLFWLVNVGIGFGGGKVLNKFTAILNPCIYIVFGGMAIWAISLVGLGQSLTTFRAVFRKQKTVASCSGGDKRGSCGLGGTGGERIRLYAKRPLVS